MEKSVKVQLAPAFAFTCPRCDSDNYLTAERYEISDDEATEWSDGDAGERFELLSGLYYVTPKKVACGHCNEIYNAEPPQTKTEDEPPDDNWEVDEDQDDE